MGVEIDLADLVSISLATVDKDFLSTPLVIGIKFLCRLLIYKIPKNVIKTTYQCSVTFLFNLHKYITIRCFFVFSCENNDSEKELLKKPNIFLKI